MSLVDSLDSVLMLYAYTNFADRKLRIFQTGPIESVASITRAEGTTDVETTVADTVSPQDADTSMAVHQASLVDNVSDSGKRRTLSSLSIVLTIMSILLAFG
jgi:high-affinity nickel-transport protein